MVEHPRRGDPARGDHPDPYRFIDDGGLPAYRMGRVIRLKAADVAAFETTCRIQPGSLSHLVPD